MKILAIGEAMIEFAPAFTEEPDLFRMGFAGDALNTAWYLRQVCPAGWQVGFLTRLGQDALSHRLRNFMASAGLYLPAVAPHENRTPGLYMVSLDRGERGFTYWRDSSAARTLMDEPDAVHSAVAASDIVYLTGITLAILPQDARARLLTTLSGSSARVVFDPNYRPQLWPDPKEARDAFMMVAAISDLVLPSFEDEVRLFSDPDPEATARRYSQSGADEVVVKNGSAAGALWFAGKCSRIPAPKAVDPVDTTGAGDSFNAGYLSVRYADGEPLNAAAKGHAVAGRVVVRRGALVPLAGE